MTTGKAYLDTRQALDDLGIDDAARARARHPPLQGRHDLAARAGGRAALRRGPAGGASSSRRSAPTSRTSSSASSTTRRPTRRPLVIGKTDETGRILLPSEGELSPTGVAHGDRRPPDEARRRHRRSSTSAWRASKPRRSCSNAPPPKVARTPFFCSGCPHNTSTRVPEGSRAMAGIGCHGMAIWMPERRTSLITPHGRRGRGLDRPGAVHRREAHLPESRRRHLLPLRPAGDPRRRRRRRQHHLQDPVQRRGRDDRRPAARRAARRCPRSPRQVAAEGAQEGRRRHRRARQVSGRTPASRTASRSAIATSSTPCSASCARSPASPCWSTTRPAPPRSAAAASAAPSPIPPSACSSTTRSARAAATARRSRNCVSVEAARDRARPQARDRPVQLQQGLLLRERLLPELRHGAWRHACARPSAAARRVREHDPFAALPMPDAAAARRALRHPRHRHRRHRRASPSAR